MGGCYHDNQSSRPHMAFQIKFSHNPQRKQKKVFGDYLYPTENKLSQFSTYLRNRLIPFVKVLIFFSNQVFGEIE